MVDGSSLAPPQAVDTPSTPVTAAAPRIRTALDRMAGMLQTRPGELFAVPAEYALDRLGARSVSLSRWERDRGLLRCVVNVGDLMPDEEQFPADETYQLSLNETYHVLTRGQGVAYDSSDPSLTADARAMLGQFGNRDAVSVPVHHGSRLWGELWVTYAGRMSPRALQDALRVAAEVAGMVSLAEQLQTMARLAFQDPLTGLGNRRQLDDALGALLAEGGAGATVVICDVDDLKVVNDQFGHEAGDQTIVAVADALAEAVAPAAGAMAARLGGDEFALVLPGEDRRRAVESVEEISRTLARRRHPITVSCGIASVAAGTPVRDTLALADAAQYAAKRRGHLLFLAEDLSEITDTLPRRRFRDLNRPDEPRPTHGQVPGKTEQTQTCLAVRELTEALPEAPVGARHRLTWLGERVTELFDLDDWSVSTVDLAGDRALRIVAMGLRDGNDLPHSAPDLLANVNFDLAAFPLSEQAILTGGWFVIDVQDHEADPAEREILLAVRKRHVVAVGCTDGGQGLLLEVYGSGRRDLDLLGSTIALAAAALLGSPLTRFVTSPEIGDDALGGPFG